MNDSSTVLLLGLGAESQESLAATSPFRHEVVETRQELADRARLEQTGCVLADIELLSPEREIRVLSEIQRRVVLPIVLVVDPEDGESVRAALQAGLFDVVCKSADSNEFASVIERATSHCKREYETRRAIRRLRKRLDDHRIRLSDSEEGVFDMLLGESPEVNGKEVEVTRSSAERTNRSRHGASDRAGGRENRDVAEQIEDLSPRLRETLEQLLQGHSEKQVAFDLGLSRHTVHDYVKALHKQFEVQSRGELIAKCLVAHESLVRG